MHKRKKDKQYNQIKAQLYSKLLQFAQSHCTPQKVTYSKGFNPSSWSVPFEWKRSLKLYICSRSSSLKLVSTFRMEAIPQAIYIYTALSGTWKPGDRLQHSGQNVFCQALRAERLLLFGTSFAKHFGQNVFCFSL